MSAWLAIILTASSCISMSAGEAQVQTQGSLTSERASKILLERLIKDQAFPGIPSKCLFVDLEEETQGYFLFTVRFNAECCGVKSESTLLERFAVIRHSQEVVWWDVADPEQFKPYKQFIRHGSMPAHRGSRPSRPNQVMHSDGAASAAPPVMTGRWAAHE